MNRFVPVVALALIGVVAPAPARDIAVMGLGVNTCQDFLDRVETLQWEREYIDWALGFMSGINFVAIKENLTDNTHELRDMSAKTPQELMAFMRDYCRAHPDHEYWQGAEALYKSFPLTPPDPPRP